MTITVPPEYVGKFLRTDSKTGKITHIRAKGMSPELKAKKKAEREAKAVQRRADKKAELDRFRIGRDARKKAVSEAKARLKKDLSVEAAESLKLAKAELKAFLDSYNK